MVGIVGIGVLLNSSVGTKSNIDEVGGIKVIDGSMLVVTIGLDGTCVVAVGEEGEGVGVGTGVVLDLSDVNATVEKAGVGLIGVDEVKVGGGGGLEIITVLVGTTTELPGTEAELVEATSEVLEAAIELLALLDKEILGERLADGVMLGRLEKGVIDGEAEGILVESGSSILGLILNENALLIVGVTITCIKVEKLSKSITLLIMNCGTVVRASTKSTLVTIAAVDEDVITELVLCACPGKKVNASDEGTTLAEGNTIGVLCAVDGCKDIAAVLTT